MFLCGIEMNKQQFHDRLIGRNRIIAKRIDQFREWIDDYDYDAVVRIVRYDDVVKSDLIRICIESPLLNRVWTREIIHDHITELFADFIEESVLIKDIASTETGLIEYTYFFVILK